MAGLWAKSPEVSCLHPGWNLLRGDDVMESWRRILSNPDQLRIVSGGAGVTLLGDAALVLCRELVGGAALIATNLFVREDGDWRLLHHHSGPVSTPDAQ